MDDELISVFLTNYWWQIMVVCISAIPTVIMFVIKGRISHWFNEDLETHRAELDRKSRQIQASLDTQLEAMRIEFGLIQSERLQILKEACGKLTEILNQINVIASYHHYDCKENVDYETKCLSEGEHCKDDCIMNYWSKIVSFDRCIRLTDDFFDNNQMFFPLEIVVKHKEIIFLLFELRKKAYDICLDLDTGAKEKALECFNLFHDFDREKVLALRGDLMDEYRLLIGVSPLKSYSVSEYRLLQAIRPKGVDEGV